MLINTTLSMLKYLSHSRPPSVLQASASLSGTIPEVARLCVPHSVFSVHHGIVSTCFAHTVVNPDRASENQIAFSIKNIKTANVFILLNPHNFSISILRLFVPFMIKLRAYTAVFLPPIDPTQKIYRLLRPYTAIAC